MTTIIILRLIYEFYFRFPHFKVIKAEMKEWINKSSEKIITYQIKIKTKKSSDELIFDEVWIGKKRYKFQISRENRRFVGSFNESELLHLNVLSEISSSEDNPPPEKSSKGKLLVGYTFKNKKKYLLVENMKEIDSLHFAA